MAAFRGRLFRRDGRCGAGVKVRIYDTHQAEPVAEVLTNSWGAWKAEVAGYGPPYYMVVVGVGGLVVDLVASEPSV